MTRVREMLERSRKSLVDGPARQRLEGSTRQLLERSRATVAQFVGSPTARDGDAQEVLAGVCSSIALRDLNLVDSLLEQLEQMEADEEDPDTLAKLYKLDHLATRLRRNGENLRVLAGREAGSGTDETAALVDVIRAGMSAIEHYARVELGTIAGLGVIGLAADDVSRLLAELLDNATTHSPPSSSVTVSAHLTEQGSVLIRIEDGGIGMPAARLSALNERLASAPVLDRNSVRHMGLAVVRRLANRHRIRVWLARRAPHGTTASVLLPVPLVREAPAPGRCVAAERSVPGSEETPPGGSAPASGESATSPGEEPAAPPRKGSSEGFVVPGGPHPEGTVFRTPEDLAAESGDEPPTTRNGLPRRVPRSLKKPSPPPPDAGPDAPERAEGQDVRGGHERLLADLGDFAEGEQAAIEERRDREDTAPTVEENDR